jgi:hypothetical protein
MKRRYDSPGESVSIIDRYVVATRQCNAKSQYPTMKPLTWNRGWHRHSTRVEAVIVKSALDWRVRKIRRKLGKLSPGGKGGRPLSARQSNTQSPSFDKRGTQNEKAALVFCGTRRNIACMPPGRSDMRIGMASLTFLRYFVQCRSRYKNSASTLECYYFHCVADD